MDKNVAKHNLTSFILNTIFSFLSFLIIVKVLDSRQMGLWILVASFFSVGSMIDFGVNTAVIRFLKQFNVQEKIDFFLTYFVLIGAIGAISMSITFFITYVSIPRNALIQTDLSADQLILILISFSSVIGFLKLFQNYFKLTLDAVGEFIYSNKISNVTVYFQFLLTIIWFFSVADSKKLIAIPLIYLLPLILSLILQIHKLTRVLFSETQFQTFFSMGILRKTFTFSFTVQLSSILGAIIDPMIKFIISSSLGLSFTTFYEIAKKITDIFFGMVISVQRQLAPDASSSVQSDTLLEFIETKFGKYRSVISSFNIIILFVLIVITLPGIFIVFKSTDSFMIYIILSAALIWQNNASGFYGVLMVSGNWQILLIFQLVNILITGMILFFGFYFFQNLYGFIGLVLVAVFNYFLLAFLLLKANRQLKHSHVFSYDEKFPQFSITLALICIFSVLNLKNASSYPVLAAVFIYGGVCFFLRKSIGNSIHEIKFLIPLRSSGE